MDTADCESDDNRLVFLNVPSRGRDEEDVRALLYVGLCIPAEQIEIEHIQRAETKFGRVGILTVGFSNLEQKMKVLSRKRTLRYTNEYCDVYIRSIKSRSDLVTERNFSTILKSIPKNHDYLMASNGKIVRRGQASNTSVRPCSNDDAILTENQYNSLNNMNTY